MAELSVLDDVRNRLCFSKELIALHLRTFFNDHLFKRNASQMSRSPSGIPGKAPGLIANTARRAVSFPFNLNDIFYELLVKQLGTLDLLGLVPNNAFKIVMNFLEL